MIKLKGIKKTAVLAGCITFAIFDNSFAHYYVEAWGSPELCNELLMAVLEKTCMKDV